MVGFDLNLIHKYQSFLQSANNKKIYHNYVDKISDWKDILEDIFYISSYKMKEYNSELKEFLFQTGKVTTLILTLVMQLMKMANYGLGVITVMVN